MGRALAGLVARISGRTVGRARGGSAHIRARPRGWAGQRCAIGGERARFAVVAVRRAGRRGAEMAHTALRRAVGVYVAGVGVRTHRSASGRLAGEGVRSCGRAVQRRAISGERARVAVVAVRRAGGGGTQMIQAALRCALGALVAGVGVGTMRSARGRSAGEGVRPCCQANRRRAIGGDRARNAVVAVGRAGRGGTQMIHAALRRALGALVAGVGVGTVRRTRRGRARVGLRAYRRTVEGGTIGRDAAGLTVIAMRCATGGGAEVVDAVLRGALRARGAGIRGRAIRGARGGGAHVGMQARARAVQRGAGGANDAGRAIRACDRARGRVVPRVGRSIGRTGVIRVAIAIAARVPPGLDGGVHAPRVARLRPSGTIAVRAGYVLARGLVRRIRPRERRVALGAGPAANTAGGDAAPHDAAPDDKDEQRHQGDRTYESVEGHDAP